MTETVSLSAEAQAWLVDGEHGISSKTIFNYLLLGRVERSWSNWPHDVDDFRRCELLLRAVPELRPRLLEMANLHPVWERLAYRWRDIVWTAEKECPGIFNPKGRSYGRAPETYGLIDGLTYQPPGGRG